MKKSLNGKYPLKKIPHTFRRDVQRQMSSNKLKMSIKHKNPLPGKMGHGLKEIDPTTIGQRQLLGLGFNVYARARLTIKISHPIRLQANLMYQKSYAVTLPVPAGQVVAMLVLPLVLSGYLTGARALQYRVLVISLHSVSKTLRHGEYSKLNQLALDCQDASITSNPTSNCIQL